MSFHLILYQAVVSFKLEQCFHLILEQSYTLFWIIFSFYCGSAFPFYVVQTFCISLHLIWISHSILFSLVFPCYFGSVFHFILDQYSHLILDQPSILLWIRLPIFGSDFQVFPCYFGSIVMSYLGSIFPLNLPFFSSSIDFSIFILNRASHFQLNQA